MKRKITGLFHNQFITLGLFLRYSRMFYRFNYFNHLLYESESTEEHVLIDLFYNRKFAGKSAENLSLNFDLWEDYIENSITGENSSVTRCNNLPFFRFIDETFGTSDILKVILMKSTHLHTFTDIVHVYLALATWEPTSAAQPQRQVYTYWFSHCCDCGGHSDIFTGLWLTVKLW